ncbi:MAG TPA: response regulator [Thermoanaerobaculia bacterium]|nr:response regulator [Thermoanaerobaculia bacterium]
MSDSLFVMLVDDDEDILRYYGSFLRANGVEVATVLSAEEALVSLERFKPELIIADVSMPGMSGYDLCRQVRALGHDDIPFLFCSAHGDLPERIEGLRAGADEYLVKPVDPEELLIKIRLHCQRNRRMLELARMARERTDLGVLSGSIAELKVPGVLQMFDFMSLTDARLTIEAPSLQAGEIFVSRGHVIHAQVGQISGKKAFCRMLDWEEGTFKLSRAFFVGDPTMDRPLQECLLEGVTQIDELRALRQMFEQRGDTLTVNEGMPSIRFQERTAHVMSLIREYQTIDSVLDASPLMDLEIMRIVLELVETGFVRVTWSVEAAAQGQRQ